MRTTRKLIVLCLAALMACLTMMPSTFSWYDHNAEEDAGYMQYSRQNLPVSGSSNLSASTIAVDKNGVATNGNTTVSNVNFSSADTKIQYYKTTLTNTSNSHDAYGDLEVGNLLNKEGIRVGITSPVINEKGFSISRTPKSNSTVRIYFIPYDRKKGSDDYWHFWYNKEYNDSTNSSTYHNNDYWDMNVRYYVGSTPTDVRMTGAPNTNNSDFKVSGTNDNAYKVYYADLPSNTTSFFFHNHWYDDNDENKDWNRTQDINELVPGTVYRLTGEKIDDSYKLHDTIYRESVAELMSYYSEVQLDLDGHIYISLKKPDEITNPEDESADYYGTSISYSSSNNNVATVDRDGLVTAASSISGNTATATITATIQGALGDTITCQTKVTVSKYIEQMPVAQNILVEAGKSVDIYWYVVNETTDTGTIADSIFWTY